MASTSSLAIAIYASASTSVHSYSVKAISVTSGVRDEHREVGLYFGDVQCRAFDDELHKLFSSQIRSVLSSGEQNAVLGWMVRMTVEERREKREERGKKDGTVTSCTR